ncbi:hypothetical protein B7H23_10345 [Notoacmeibacter marinus]|uniref:CidA/LrgA family protein n=1 Tax=Notoacmeibacter marinus TaxID=1876515 RepID=A0A231UYT3_9HYPH|nr:CidA/LrgA family protein [Notoacmeibacter marinus]OXT00506.1 hypothetical protein B7H23_10345 [Notoacmeibacter marinus]
MLHALTAILICQLVGETIAAAGGLPVPGPVLGMVLLFVVLLVRGRIGDNLERVGGTLLSYLSLLFVPAGVGVITHLGALRSSLLPLATAIVVPTLLTIIVSALLVKWLDRTDSGSPEEGPAGGNIQP